MRLRLVAKIYTVIIGTIVLALATSILTTLVARRVSTLFEHAVTDNVTSVRAAEELELALLQQSLALRSYVLDDGNRQWLEELRSARNEYRKWWSEAQETAHTAVEQDILLRLERVHRQYVPPSRTRQSPCSRQAIRLERRTSCFTTARTCTVRSTRCVRIFWRPISDTSMRPWSVLRIMSIA